ncbi:hypothetical protein Cgig2_019537 [Carnegiea gigantea]|uniref:MULE transposase domain-containing protein n=1 Tax=Carnegiea gigantea TaxID=171969 RepID=A0A9Q1QIE0_9CARY|nr:hypothetical protein Cgig2_019537 [Carnegiea gigantea]
MKVKNSKLSSFVASGKSFLGLDVAKVESMILSLYVEKRHYQPSFVRIARRKKSITEPLNVGQSQTFAYSEEDLSIVRLDLDEFHDFDVLNLGQPQIPEFDVFESDVDENVEEPVEKIWSQISRGYHEDADGNEGHVIISKLAKVFKQGRLWGRNRDGSVSLKEGDKFACKEDLLIAMKDYYHICGRTEAKKSASSRWVVIFLLSYYGANPNAAVKNMEDFIMTQSIQGSPNETIGLDGNNGQFPLAYGITPQENEEEWSCFPEGLVRALDARENSSIYTIMSNRHEDIIKALKNVMPQASRRIYVLHFYKNFTANYPSTWFHCLFYIATNVYSSLVHLKAINKTKERESAAYHWLRDNEPLQHWVRFKFDVNLKSDDNTNNFVKSFNNAITELRGKPMFTMLEEIRKLMGARFDKEFQNASCEEGKCKMHLKMKGKLEDHYTPWFSTKNYRKLCDNIIHPISNPCMCKQCKQLGHNSLTCGRPGDHSGRLVERYKRKKKTGGRPIGRPRKTHRAIPGTSIATVAPPTQSSQA